jgi:hypothetical protein
MDEAIRKPPNRVLRQVFLPKVKAFPKVRTFQAFANRRIDTYPGLVRQKERGPNSKEICGISDLVQTDTSSDTLLSQNFITYCHEYAHCARPSRSEVSLVFKPERGGWTSV